MTRPTAGSIVLVDWRGDRRPKEPGKIRPAIVVEDHRLFPDDFPNIVVVPLTHDRLLAIPAFAELIHATSESGSQEPSWALANHVTTVSLQRVTMTESRISDDTLKNIHTRIAFMLGIR